LQLSFFLGDKIALLQITKKGRLSNPPLQQY